MIESIPKHLANLTSVSSNLFLNMLQFELLKVVDEFRPALLKLLRRLRRLYAPGQGLLACCFLFPSGWVCLEAFLIIQRFKASPLPIGTPRPHRSQTFIMYHFACFTLQSSKKYPYNWWRWAWLASNNKQLHILWRLSPKKHVYRAKIGGWSLARWALLRQWLASPTSSHSIWPHRFRHKQISNGEAETNKSRQTAKQLKSAYLTIMHGTSHWHWWGVDAREQIETAWLAWWRKMAAYHPSKENHFTHLPGMWSYDVVCDCSRLKKVTATTH